MKDFIKRSITIILLLIGLKSSLASKIDSMTVMVQSNTIIKVHLYFSELISDDYNSDTFRLVVSPNNIEIGIGFSYDSGDKHKVFNMDTMIVIHKLPECVFKLKCLLYEGAYDDVIQNFHLLSYNCVDSIERTFEQLSLFNPLPNEIPFCEFEKKDISLDADAGFVFYDWQPGGQHSQFITIDSIGKYFITVTDTNGCFGKDSVTIKDNCPFTCFIPNAFTPNDDNMNDTFQPVCSYISESKLFIYNRWGELIFESVDINKGWDGRCQGIMMNSGMFVYSLETTLQNGETINRKGNISLIR